MGKVINNFIFATLLTMTQNRMTFTNPLQKFNYLKSLECNSNFVSTSDADDFLKAANEEGVNSAILYLPSKVGQKYEKEVIKALPKYFNIHPSRIFRPRPHTRPPLMGEADAIMLFRNAVYNIEIKSYIPNQRNSKPVDPKLIEKGLSQAKRCQYVYNTDRFMVISCKFQPVDLGVFKIERITVEHDGKLTKYEREAIGELLKNIN